MPRKWRNRISTRCSSNVNVTISVSKTVLQLDLVTSIQRVVRCCHLASPNLKNSHVSSKNFHVSICFHSREKIRIPYNLNAPRSYRQSQFVLLHCSDLILCLTAPLTAGRSFNNLFSNSIRMRNLDFIKWITLKI